MPRAWEETLVSLCLDADPTAALDAAGGDRARWTLIRSMARARLVRACREGLPQLHRALGDEVFAATVEAWMATGRPHVRYFRKIGEEFSTFVDRTTLDARALRALDHDLSVLHVRDDPADDPLPLLQFDLTAPLRLTPFHRVVAALEKADTSVIVWRSSIDGRALWRELPSWYVGWLTRLNEPGQTGTGALQAALAADERVVDAALLDIFSTHTSSLAEKGAFVVPD